MYEKRGFGMNKVEPSQLLVAAGEHAEAGRWLEAEDAFAAALLNAPDLHIARFQLGLVQWSQVRRGAALVTWQPLLDAAPGLDVAHFARAFALWSALDLAGAESEFAQGVGCCRNQPLAQDMSRLHDSVKRQLGATSDANSDAQHVLLVNYVKAGQAH
jgi:tetratricopeptide (TPR) repeat protein